jgi:thiol:disulfide interchange protein DsbD
MRIMSLFLSLPVVLAATHAFGQSALLKSDDAFHLSASRDNTGVIQISWTIADGYYLYRDRVDITNTDRKASLPVELPAGVTKNDPNFGTTDIYHGEITVKLGATDQKQITVQYQGCKENSICYPPIAKRVDLTSFSIADQEAGPVKPIRHQ